MKSLSERLDEATHADWSGGAPAVEPQFARDMVNEVLRLQSLVRYELVVRGRLIDDICHILDTEGPKRTIESIKAEVQKLKGVYAEDIPQAWLDVIAERRRQRSVLGYTPSKDDAYIFDELPRAAIAYIMWTYNPGQAIPSMWPWSRDRWKPKTPRENMVRAIALLIAEAERMDRRP